MLALILQTFANEVYSQKTKLSLDYTNTRLEIVLDEIEDLSEFFFLANEKLVDLDRSVSLTVENKKIDEILDMLFAGTDVVYTITDRKIILAPSFLTEDAQQQRTVSGKVTDSDGQPLPGVTVVVKGTTTGTVTNTDGNFSLTIPNDAETLQFSFIGMRTQEVSIDDRTSFTVVMEIETIGLEEVVAIGYGTQKKVNLTGSVSAVKVDEVMTSRSVGNVSTGLTGMLPGLSVSTNTGMAGRNNVSLLIRGVGTVNNAEPLIVVDGMPDVDINRINMNDIESVSVLKDAASSAVYGSRAANGVILITTKTGKGVEETRIRVNSSYSVSQPVKAIAFMPDYPRSLSLTNTAAAWHIRPQNFVFKDGTIDQWMALGMIDPLRYPNTDWWDVIMRDGTTLNHNVSAQGSTDRSNFFVSGGVMDEKGLQIGNDYSRYNTRFNYDYKLRHNMNIGTRFAANWTNYEFSLSEGFNDDGSAGDDIQYAVAGITPYDPETGHFGGVMAYNESAQAYNPYTRYINQKTFRERQEINPSIYWDWSPAEGLTARIDYAINYYHEFSKSAPIPNRSWNFQTEQYGARVYVQPSAGVSNTMNNGYKTNFSSRLNYFTVIKENHEISAMAVYSNEYWHNRRLSGSRNDRLHPSLTEIDAALEDVQSASGNLNTEGLESYIGRINYVGFNKYLLEANFRYDGSSRFSEGSQYGFFPSASVGWIFTMEEFISPFTDQFMTIGKFRFSYGGLGNNSGVGRYEQKETLETNNYIIDGNIVKGFVNSKMINLNLSWETTYVMNIGIDLGFLDNRLTTEIDYYDRLTVDMLRPSEMSLHLTGAYDAPRQNIGELRNKGIEGNFTWRDNFGALKYTINFNASHNRNRLEKWNEYLGRGTTFINMPLDFLYAYEDIGIAQTWQEIYNYAPQNARPGDIIRLDLNGDGQISGEDRKAYPQWTTNRPNTDFALRSNFVWKGIDLGIFFQGSAGRRDTWLNIYNATTIQEARQAMTYEHLTHPWNHDNRDASWPRIVERNISDAGSNRNTQTFWLDNMTFLRLKNVQLGYNIPRQAISKIGLNDIRVYFSGENLVTFTKYRGLDPEKQGDPNDAYPILKSFTFGINVTI
jgi:TonB-linked SusC/RagA family outer membrane protein